MDNLIGTEFYNKLKISSLTTNYPPLQIETDYPPLIPYEGFNF